MDESQEFCIRWGSYQQQLSEALRNLLKRELLVDVTLACDGRSLRAHRAVLSACSKYFQDLFQESEHSHPIVILKDVKFEELEALVQFMYHGEVNINNNSLPGFLKTAEMLHIRGLTSAGQNMITPSNQKELSQSVEQETTFTDVNTSTDNLTPPTLTLSTDNLSETMQAKRIKREHNISSHSSQEGNYDQQHSQAKKQECNLPCNSVSSQSVNKNLLKTNELQMLSSEQYPEQELPHKSIASLECLSPISLPHQEEMGSSSHFTIHQNQNACQSVVMMPRPCRQRVLWNQEQLIQLETWYREDRYPSGHMMYHYANTLAAMNPTGTAPTRQNVDYWFQNRRRKDSHPEVMQQREKKKLSKTLWGAILDQRDGQSGT